jgi:hypothetical protein
LLAVEQLMQDLRAVAVAVATGRQLLETVLAVGHLLSPYFH